MHLMFRSSCYFAH